MAVRAVAELCEGELSGAEVGSQEIVFHPGPRLRAGQFSWDIGTAGSTTMLALTVLPLLAFSPAPSRVRISGGLFQDFAPSAFHTQQVLLPTLGEMGLEAKLSVVRPGYVPRGGGEIELVARPAHPPLRPLQRPQPVNPPQKLWGVALSSHLRARRVSHRLAESCQRELARHGLSANFEVVYDDTARQPGAALAVFAAGKRGERLGADRAGAPGRRAEDIGRDVAQMLVADLSSGASVDRFLADQLILYAALARGETRYLIPSPTDHVQTNLWLVEEILGAKWELTGNLLRIEGIGFER
jgi:RNA 3'-terminal phosphate cyclase (ATP)